MNTALKSAMKSFLRDSWGVIERYPSREVINKYFIVNDDFEKKPVVYLKAGKLKYSLGEHSTLDITDARNFVVYFRKVFNNLLEQDENS